MYFDLVGATCGRPRAFTERPYGYGGSNLSTDPKRCASRAPRKKASTKFRSLASKSRHRRVWNQGEDLYGIATKSRMESSRSDVWNQSEGWETWIRAKARCHAVAKRRITCNARGALITYQSFGLDRKKHLLAQVLFSGWDGRIWTDECGSQSPVPYRLATSHNGRLLRITATALLYHTIIFVSILFSDIIRICRLFFRQMTVSPN